MPVTRSSNQGDLQSDPEIEKTIRRICRLRREAQNISENNYPVIDSLIAANLDLEEENTMAKNRTLKELAAPDLNQQPLCITFPTLDATTTFELKYGLIYTSFTYFSWSCR